MLTPSKIDHMRIFTTREYHKFKTIGGNRNVNPNHLHRLKQSMEERPLISPILVNERFEIIDGQHRFLVRQQLELPIQYIIADGYGLNEVHILNTNSRNWTPNDYMEGYILLGFKDYELFKQFREEFHFGHSAALAILSDRDISGGDAMVKAFRNGEFKISNFKRATDCAKKITMVSKYYTEFNTRNFVIAMMQCFKNPEYDHDTFMQKLEYQSLKLVKVADKAQALAMIEEIYNYRNKVKVNLRIKN